MKAYTVQIDEAFEQTLVAHAAERDLSVEDFLLSASQWLIAEDEMYAREPFTPEQIAQIEEGLAEADRGETFSSEEVMAQIREKFPEATGRQIIERALESYSEFLNLAADLPALDEDADTRVAEGLAAMERGDETPQDEVFARWRAKYG
ncbi:hypothetical protein DMC25_12780 [Caulobacter sp. D4A]|uniref:hypothetical protein n=1 Tax=unclassified Caulobacter TaxID=2648921 RepID=UPI000D728322|nr:MULTISPECIES: hypothetical protein [unclassified Caulobacter]PXA85969.1 hypothetical protein DMC18_22425 [Caulobacter sp. D5]PXA87323.1 hypothetical protein DMC25_12780 [Caulobacter sp. D4A]